MTYYGIVDKIKPQFESGIYGRRKLSQSEAEEIKEIVKSNGLGLSWDDFIPIWGWIKLAIKVPKMFKLHKLEKIEKEPLCLQYSQNKKGTGKNILIPHNLLNNYYDIENNKDLFYGLFDDFSLEKKAFETIMKSKGGSELIIIERDSLPKNIKHYGGKDGRFDLGLYCTHPKDDNQLIPLKNLNELLKNLILEETLSTYEALGAKKIIIEDKTTIHADSGASKKGVGGGNANVNYTKEILREKSFGKGTFDPERALSDKLFIHDFPNIKTTVIGRIDGNQTVEKFTETVNLNAGLDVNVLSLYKANANFEYTRRWYFEVEFYDKNEL